MRRIILICSILALAFSGCVDTSTPADLPDLATLELPIINGVPPDAPRHEAVVAILITRSDGWM